jgi:hypothetical protein
MAFPTSPTNGQITIVGGVAYQYATTTNSWGRIVSTANVITANVITVDTLTANTLNVNNNLYNIAGNISATGNITGNYILGNGSQLTGIATGSISNITSGTSNITIVSSGGNATVNIGGTADVAVFAVTGEYVTGVVSASGNVTGGNILTGGLISATGALSVTGATTLTTVSTGNISAGNVYSGGSITTGSLISAVGNVNAGNVVTGGLISATGNVSSGASINTVNLSVSGNVLGNLLPSANVTYDLGSPTQMWRTIYVSGNTIVLGAANLSVSNGDLSVGGNPVVTVSPTGTSNTTGNMNVIGNITGSNITTAGLISAVGNVTGNYFVGNGSQLTGIQAGAVTTFSSTAPVSPAQGDIWIESDTGIQYIYFNDGTSSQWAEMEAQTSIASGADLSSVAQDIIPSANITYDLGSTTHRWRDIYLSGNTINLGGATIKTDAASGAIALIPEPTVANPNPSGMVVSPSGGITVVTTVGGEVSGNAIANAAASPTAAPVPIDITTTPPTNGQALIWDAANTEFVPGNVAGGGTPGGSNTQVQFNDGSAFGGSAGFTFDKTSNSLVVNGVISGGFLIENSQTVAANYTITAGKSAMSSGPMTINTGVTVTIPLGSRWVIL